MPKTPWRSWAVSGRSSWRRPVVFVKQKETRWKIPQARRALENVVERPGVLEFFSITAVFLFDQTWRSGAWIPTLAWSGFNKFLASEKFQKNSCLAGLSHLDICSTRSKNWLVLTLMACCAETTLKLYSVWSLTFWIIAWHSTKSVQFEAFGMKGEVEPCCPTDQRFLGRTFFDSALLARQSHFLQMTWVELWGAFPAKFSRQGSEHPKGTTPKPTQKNDQYAGWPPADRNAWCLPSFHKHRLESLGPGSVLEIETSHWLNEFVAKLWARISHCKHSIAPVCWWSKRKALLLNSFEEHMIITGAKWSVLWIKQHNVVWKEFRSSCRGSWVLGVAFAGRAAERTTAESIYPKEETGWAGGLMEPNGSRRSPRHQLWTKKLQRPQKLIWCSSCWIQHFEGFWLKRSGSFCYRIWQQKVCCRRTLRR